MLSRQRFIQQIFNLSADYQRDNAWVDDWKEKWSNEHVMTRFVTCAYNLYAATARNALKLTVLGGTEIRLDNTYVRNFGVTAANGIQETETVKWVVAEQIRRYWRARNPAPGANNPEPQAPVMGVGSILSEKGWTPILNDALILGAITGEQEFALGLTPAEQVDWSARTAGQFNRATKIAERFGPQVGVVKAWRDFFNSQKRMFFFPNGDPRVFTRELLGLYFFGYQAQLSWGQLAFKAGPRGTCERPDFDTYLRKLRQVHFHKPADQVVIMRAISEFIFQDPDAIGSPWPADTKTAV